MSCYIKKKSLLDTCNISLEYLKRGFIKQIVISHLFCLAANRFIFEMEMRNKILSAVILIML
jgi:hypothetical protein